MIVADAGLNVLGKALCDVCRCRRLPNERIAQRKVPTVLSRRRMAPGAPFGLGQGRHCIHTDVTHRGTTSLHVVSSRGSSAATLAALLRSSATTAGLKKQPAPTPPFLNKAITSLRPVRMRHLLRRPLGHSQSAGLPAPRGRALPSAPSYYYPPGRGLALAPNANFAAPRVARSTSVTRLAAAPERLSSSAPVAAPPQPAPVKVGASQALLSSPTPGRNLSHSACSQLFPA